MRFRAVHKLMSYLLSAAAVGTLMSTGVMPLPTLALLGVVAVLSWFVEPGTRLGQLLDRGGLVVNISALAFFGLSLFEVVRSFPEPDLSPLMNLVLFLLGYKLFQRRSNRDYLQIYVLSFLLVLASAWLAQSVLFVVGFGAYVMLATWTLILFHLRREIEDNYLVKHLPDAASERITAARVLNSRRVVGRMFFLVTGLVSVAVFAGAALVFALVPRIGIGLLSGTFRRRVGIVGFSDEVTLGHHGVLSGDNQTVVLRATLPRLARMDGEDARERTIAQFYWRGTVYDTYRVDQGMGRWVRSGQSARSGFERVPAPDGEGSVRVVVPPELSPSAGPNHAGFSVRKLLAGAEEQDIQIGTLSDPVAFALDQPLAFKNLPQPIATWTRTSVDIRNPGEFWLRVQRMDPTGQMRAARDQSGAHYVAYSRDPLQHPNLQAGLPVNQVDPTLLASYLTLPATLSPRVVALARTITGGKATPAAKVQAILEWLQRTHGYTTDLQRDASIADPLEDFLFRQKAGHCEYFASAAAVLLRLSGIPSRYVNGFLGGEWNNLAKVVTVRDNRAHSWAEAYLGQFGWVRVDATPASTATSKMSQVRQLFDSVELFWSRWVIEYDASRQIELARKLGQGLGLSRGRGPASGFKLPDRKWVFVGLGVVVVGIVLVRLWRSRRGGGARRQGRARRDAAPIIRLYQRTVDRLAAQGFARQPTETPREFALRLQGAGIAGANVLARLTEIYCAARFGGHEVDPALAEALARELVGLDPRVPAARAAA